MKRVVIVLFISFFVPACCFAQTGDKMPIPVLKEAQKIDRLMDLVFDQAKATANIDQKLLKDSCWIIEMFRNSRNISFQVICNSKPAINFRINLFESNGGKYGYFNYKGNNVFVWTQDTFGAFFMNTDYVKSFNFITYTTDAKLPEHELYPYTLHYNYADGRFTAE
jgi:hypothetical protein